MQFTVLEVWNTIHPYPLPLISLLAVKDAAALVGPASRLVWSSDGYALAVSWDNCGWALWSVSGGLLYTSLGERVGLAKQLRIIGMVRFILVDFSAAWSLLYLTELFNGSLECLRRISCLLSPYFSFNYAIMYILFRRKAQTSCMQPREEVTGCK